MNKSDFNVERIMALLHVSDIFKSLDNADKMTLTCICNLFDFEENELVFSESQPANSLYVVEHGLVSMLFSGREPIEVRRGQMFGEMAIINNIARLATVTTKTKTTLMKVSGSKLYDEAHIPAAVALKITRAIAQKMTNVSRTRSQISTLKIIENGEHENMEFKSTLRMNLKTGAKDPAIELSVLKTVAAFLNAHGGTLLVGVNDSGEILGNDADQFSNNDKMLLHFDHLVQGKLGAYSTKFIHYDMVRMDEARFILRVDCEPATKPVFVKDGNNEYFFVRTGASTTNLSISEAVEYIREKF